MNVESNNGEGDKEVEEEVVDPGETVVLTEVDTDDSLAETTVGLDVDAMVAKIENADSEELAKKREAKKKLDELEELNKDDEFGSTYAFDIDEDLPT